MLRRLADHSFEPYGTCYREAVDISKKELVRQEISTNTKRINQLFVFPCEIYIECPQGLARILVCASPDGNQLRTFPVRDYIRLAPGICFNLIPLSTPLTWHLITPPIQPDIIELPNPYNYQPVSVPFHVRRILDCWFTDSQNHCTFTRQINRSYELIYVYEGSLNITLSSGSHALQAHDVLLYRSDKAIIEIGTSCSYLTAIFDVNQRKTLHILNHTFHCNSELQQILWKLLIESFENTYYTQTLMVCYLQEALLLLMQFYDTLNHKILLTDSQASRNDLLSEILTYMNKRIAEPITIEEICHEFYISRSSLQALFKTNLNTSPKNYLINIKLQKSKELIRENQYTISEIAYKLGFSSIHYFSRLFKKYFNITPSAYIRKIAENQSEQIEH